MANRTDPHRPGSIVPADYDFVMWYALSSSYMGFPMPPLNIDLWLKLSHEPGFKRAEHGGLGKCSVCGSHFNEGEVWKHRPTGEHIHVGHICAEKYELMADWSEAELALGNRKKAAAVEVEKAQRAEARGKFLAKHPALLAEALDKGEHAIIADIRERFMRWADMSDKQVALVMKLYGEQLNPPAAEVHVPAPVSDKRVTFTGTIVGAKLVEGNFGTQCKVTVKVQEAGGTWLAYGTCPAAIVPMGDLADLKGKQATITAKLAPGRDPHFVFMNRPSGKLVA